MLIKESQERMVRERALEELENERSKGRRIWDWKINIFRGKKFKWDFKDRWSDFIDEVCCVLIIYIYNL